MTEIVHFRCDRCDYDVVAHTLQDAAYFEWARVSIGLKCFHFCPACWKIIANYRQAEPAS